MKTELEMLNEQILNLYENIAIIASKSDSFHVSRIHDIVNRLKELTALAENMESALYLKSL